MVVQTAPEYLVHRTWYSDLRKNKKPPANLNNKIYGRFIVLIIQLLHWSSSEVEDVIRISLESFNVIAVCI